MLYAWRMCVPARTESLHRPQSATRHLVRAAALFMGRSCAPAVMLATCSATRTHARPTANRRSESARRGRKNRGRGSPNPRRTGANGTRPAGRGEPKFVVTNVTVPESFTTSTVGVRLSISDASDPRTPTYDMSNLCLALALALAAAANALPRKLEELPDPIFSADRYPTGTEECAWLNWIGNRQGMSSLEEVFAFGAEPSLQ